MYQGDNFNDNCIEYDEDADLEDRFDQLMSECDEEELTDAEIEDIFFMRHYNGNRYD